MADGVRNLDQALATISEHWQPHRLTSINDYDVKVVKVQGEFVWHTHPDTDELFLVLDGELTIDTEDGAIVLRPHEMVTIPRGMRHRPRASLETAALLIELAGVVNTGDAEPGELTATPERL